MCVGGPHLFPSLGRGMPNSAGIMSQGQAWQAHTFPCGQLNGLGRMFAP